MKILNIILTSTILFLFSCKNCECTPENTLAMNNITFNDQFECLNIEELKEKENSFGEYSEYTNDGKIKVLIVGGNWGFTHYLNIDSLNYISIHKSYYPDGKIKMKGLYNDLGFQIGSWYEFTSSGNLSKTIDTEKGFDFTFEKLKEKLIKEEKLSFNSLPSKIIGNWGNEYPINIQKDTEGRPMWRVRYKDKDNSMNGIYGTEVEIYYDGKTGERISRELDALNPNS